MNITKNSFSDLRFATYTNKFLIKWTLKNTFLDVFSVSVPVRYCRFRLFFSKKQQYVTCSHLCPSWDLSLGSSWGADFKYIYFLGEKPSIFHIDSLIIFTFCFHIHMNSRKLTFTWILPEIISWILVFLHKPIHSLLSVVQKNNFWNFFHFLFLRYCLLRDFFSKK